MPLFPEEETHVLRAVARRRDEFSTGRWCARQALTALGAAPTAIPVGPWRNPIWIDGVTGSISHSTTTCAAVVVRCTAWNAIGIDVLDRESAATLPAGAERLVTLDSDGEVLTTIPAWVPPLALLFSAKESAIKAFSPACRRFVDFTEVRLRFDGSTFTAILDSADRRVDGWWATAMDALILTGAVLV